MLNSQRRRGVTLIELVVAIAVLAGLLALALPDVRDWMRNLKVRTAAESVRNGLELARMEALRRNQQVGFWLVRDSTSPVPTNACALSSTSAAWVVSVSSPAGHCGEDPSLTDAPQLVQRSTARENASDLVVAAKDAAGITSTQVLFNGLGQVQGGAGVSSIAQIDLESSGGGRKLRVTVEGGGAIRMCEIGVAAGDARAC